MFYLSIKTVFPLLLVGSLVSAFPTGEEPAEPTISRTRLSELPKNTLYDYKYFDLGRGRPQSFHAAVLLGSVACELTVESPLANDAVDALKLFDDAPEGSICCQTSTAGPRCTGLKTNNTAVLSLCGGYQRCLYCADIADFLLLIIDNCQEGDKVGGSLKLAEISSTPEGGRIMVSSA